MAIPLDGTFRFDGKKIPFRDGDTIGSALHRAGVRTISRSMKYHRPRGLFCCTGSCASCLVDVDGVPNLPACMTGPTPGMAVQSQNRIGSAKRDLLAVTDTAFPDGFDPHGAFTRPRILNNLFLRAVRFMSGWGKVPSGPSREPAPLRRTLRVDELIVGAGDAGMARAQESTGNVLLVDEQVVPSADLPKHVQSWSDALAFGIYDGVVAIRRGRDLWEVTADRITLATGVHDDWPLFEGNDRPGILSLRGARRLLEEHGVLPGRRIVGHGDPLPADFVEALEAAGAEVVAQGTVCEARGNPVRKAEVDGTWHRCDTVVSNLPGVPRIELFQQAGCELGWQDGAIRPVLDADGRSTISNVHGVAA